MKNLPKSLVLISFAFGAIGYVGCHERPRLTDRQVDELLSMPADATEASKELVSHDAQSRKDWLALRRDLTDELTEIGRRQEQLEADRRAIARQRRADPIVAAAIDFAAVAFVCGLPVLVIACLLWPRRIEEPAHLCDFLVETVEDHQAKILKLEDRRKA